MCLRLQCLSSCSVLSSSVCKIRFNGSSLSELDNQLVVGGIVNLFHNILLSVYNNIDIFPEIQSKNVLSIT